MSLVSSWSTSQCLGLVRAFANININIYSFVFSIPPKPKSLSNFEDDEHRQIQLLQQASRGQESPRRWIGDQLSRNCHRSSAAPQPSDRQDLAASARRRPRLPWVDSVAWGPQRKVFLEFVLLFCIPLLCSICAYQWLRLRFVSSSTSFCSSGIECFGW